MSELIGPQEMREKLDLVPIKVRRRDILCSVRHDCDALLAEIERLRGELVRQAEQITAVRVLHGRMVNNENVCDTCTDHRGLYLLWPCPTIAALGDDS